tara:strand:- start:1507 stop:1977 length:471 start_codon:yes stop_codon:yes gene_type:complete
MTASLPYRPCVGVMLLNAQNQVFVGQRIDRTSEAWQMPQGGMDPGEDPLTTARRELREETGVTDVTVLAESSRWLHYDLPEDLVPKMWGGKYRGQEQKWFLMRLNADDSHINIATEEPEFSAWRWLDVQEVPNVIVPFKQQLYRDIVAEFTPYIIA